jgi:hypothetical protein
MTTLKLRRFKLIDLPALICIGIVSFILFLLLLPNIDESRTEVRIGEAYRNVLQLTNAPHVREHFREGNTSATVELPETDPWDTPYRVMISDNKLRVESAGPNQSFESNEDESDDIYSDMPVSPIEFIHAQKRRQIWVTLAASVAIWGIITVLYFYSRKR